jgi:hypothetical protein
MQGMAGVLVTQHGLFRATAAMVAGTTACPGDEGVPVVLRLLMLLMLQPH